MIEVSVVDLDSPVPMLSLWPGECCHMLLATPTA